MGRIYNVTFEDIAVSAAQDLIQLKGATGKICFVRRQWLSFTNTTLPTAQGIKVRSRFLPATVTDGSGGGTPTVSKLDPGDAAASVTALRNNTTQATTNGTAIVLEEGGDHIYNPYEKVFPQKTPPTIGPSESFVFELLSTVTGTVNMSGGIEIEECGG